MCFSSSISNDVKNDTSVTHRLLLALLLDLDVWDLPLGFHRCDRLRVAHLAIVLCSKTYGCILL
jgi:hypothetical protein